MNVKIVDPNCYQIPQLAPILRPEHRQWQGKQSTTETDGLRSRINDNAGCLPVFARTFRHEPLQALKVRWNDRGGCRDLKGDEFPPTCRPAPQDGRRRRSYPKRKARGTKEHAAVERVSLDELARVRRFHDEGKRPGDSRRSLEGTGTVTNGQLDTAAGSTEGLDTHFMAGGGVTDDGSAARACWTFSCRVFARSSDDAWTSALRPAVIRSRKACA